MLLAGRPLHLSRLSSEKQGLFPQIPTQNGSSGMASENRWLWEFASRYLNISSQNSHIDTPQPVGHTSGMDPPSR